MIHSYYCISPSLDVGEMLASSGHIRREFLCADELVPYLCDTINRPVSHHYEHIILTDLRQRKSMFAAEF